VEDANLMKNLTKRKLAFVEDEFEGSRKDVKFHVIKRKIVVLISLTTHMSKRCPEVIKRGHPKDIKYPLAVL